MKYLFSFTMACCLLLSSCSESTNPDDNFPTNARDFLFAGNVGTEIVLVGTDWVIDTNGVKTVSQNTDTTILTILERDVLHPVGGASIRIREEVWGTKIGRYSDSTLYYSYQDSCIMVYSGIRDSEPDIILANPLMVGRYWPRKIASGEFISMEVKSVGENINTPYKQMKTVRVEIKDSDKYKLDIPTWKFFFAPEVLEVRSEYSVQTIYPSNKTSTYTYVRDLIRYTKK